MNFNAISKEITEKLNVEEIDVFNDEHMETVKEVLSKYITNEELLFHVLFSLRSLENGDNRL